VDVEQIALKRSNGVLVEPEVEPQPREGSSRMALDHIDLTSMTQFFPSSRVDGWKVERRNASGQMSVEGASK